MKAKAVTLILCYFLLLVKLASAHPAIGIVMDSKGVVYYTDLLHVWKISPDGSHTIAVKNVHTHQLYLDKEDNLYGEHSWYEGEATDQWGHYIWRLNNDGELEYTVPRTEGLPVNNTLIRDHESNEYWTEKFGTHEVIKKKTANGEIDLHTDHRFQDIRWICTSREGKDLYVIDHLTLKKVSAKGQVVNITDNLKESSPPFFSVSDHHYLMGVWTDAEAYIYVAVFGARKVKRITPEGKVETVLEAPENWSPTGGLVASDSSLWVLEFSRQNKARVRKVSPDGKILIFQT
ncbi:hypothetical protein OKW21_004663 [Catalinimonas alkaloidigena]|uniref:SMP-30/gluconolactonase/LRE family protein n=1 Tax=Catalinimonas alkaloidigena TaxID=1075417 RepID=UPI002407536C|nr:SMP-30/gluconolactonase/LRE family protein [Catalinimonas alkaloidigena]MDF9799400.1 hypothetical protein [Catalinimonas alkaloidigena]